MKTVTTKPLTQVQINATIERLSAKYADKVAAADTRDVNAANKLREKALENLCASIPAYARGAVVKAIGSSKIKGIPDYVHYFRGSRTKFNILSSMLNDLRYAMIMADNTTFQHYIDKFEQQTQKLLK